MHGVNSFQHFQRSFPGKVTSPNQLDERERNLLLMRLRTQQRLKNFPCGIAVIGLRLLDKSLPGLFDGVLREGFVQRSEHGVVRISIPAYDKHNNRDQQHDIDPERPFPIAVPRLIEQ
ncbi:hypothetical protein [Peristeroidobacter agariperforans]|uniref:hypothetical protein n=1 Tax=Peristeroidobacter agariperforans TaxID=268404 RepID=UPI001E5680C5|nr:hypothetical protein [Peristeroidobacter agariperforans]